MSFRQVVKNSSLRIRTEFRDFMLYFILPMPGVLLPWRFSYPVYKKICQTNIGFGLDEQAVLNYIKNLGIAGDSKQKLANLKLTLLFDIIDMWNGILLRGLAAKRLVIKQGDWPAQPGIIIGTHVGPGTLCLQSMRDAGLLPYYVIRPRERALRKYRFFLYVYRKIRAWYLNRVLPGRRFNTGNNPRTILQLIDAGQSILLLADAPPASRRRAIRVAVNGAGLYVHAGITSLIARKGIPFCTYKISLDWQTGRRILRIDQQSRIADQAALEKHIAGFVASSISGHPGQWQMLPFLPAYRLKQAD